MCKSIKTQWRMFRSYLQSHFSGDVKRIGRWRITYSFDNIVSIAERRVTRYIRGENYVLFLYGTHLLLCMSAKEFYFIVFWVSFQVKWMICGYFAKKGSMMGCLLLAEMYATFKPFIEHWLFTNDRDWYDMIICNDKWWKYTIKRIWSFLHLISTKKLFK